MAKKQALICLLIALPSILNGHPLEENNANAAPESSPVDSENGKDNNSTERTYIEETFIEVLLPGTALQNNSALESLLNFTIPNSTNNTDEPKRSDTATRPYELSSTAKNDRTVRDTSLENSDSSSSQKKTLALVKEGNESSRNETVTNSSTPTYIQTVKNNSTRQDDDDDDSSDDSSNSDEISSNESNQNGPQSDQAGHGRHTILSNNKKPNSFNSTQAGIIDLKEYSTNDSSDDASSEDRIRPIRDLPSRQVSNSNNDQSSSEDSLEKFNQSSSGQHKDKNRPARETILNDDNKPKRFTLSQGSTVGLGTTSTQKPLVHSLAQTYIRPARDESSKQEAQDNSSRSEEVSSSHPYESSSSQQNEHDTSVSDNTSNNNDKQNSYTSLQVSSEKN